MFLLFVGIDGGGNCVDFNCIVYVNGCCELYWKLDCDEVWNVVVECVVLE